MLPMPPKHSRPTVATIARDLGISPATVSYALNDKPGVGAATRERVLEHARAVGWTPHSGAQALRRGRSGNIGLVLVRDPEEVSREPFYASVTAGIESATSAYGYELLIRFVEGGEEQEIEVFRTWSHQRRVDGVVLLDLTANDHRPPVLDSLGMDFAVLGHYQGPEDYVKVASAEPADAATVIEHVLAQGYDGCLQLTGPLEYAHEQRRLDLIAQLCTEHGLAHSHRAGRYTIASGQEALEQVDRGFCARPALITSSDLIAIGALRAASALGLDVPEEMGLVSWDDSLIAEVTSPSITALARRPFTMGHAAGDLLVRRVEGEAPPGETVHSAPAQLVPRASTARA